jgi:hypothetical protein
VATLDRTLDRLYGGVGNDSRFGGDTIRGEKTIL